MGFFGIDGPGWIADHVVGGTGGLPPVAVGLNRGAGDGFYSKSERATVLGSGSNIIILIVASAKYDSPAHAADRAMQNDINKQSAKHDSSIRFNCEQSSDHAYQNVCNRSVLPSTDPAMVEWALFNESMALLGPINWILHPFLRLIRSEATYLGCSTES
jgi:hypothetical protein